MFKWEEEEVFRVEVRMLIVLGVLRCCVDWKNIGRFDKKGNGVSNVNLEYRDLG